MKIQKLSLETEFQRFLRDCIENDPKRLNSVLRHLHIEGLEIPLSEPMSLITREVDPFSKSRSSKNIGRIDIVFRYRKFTYVGEIKDYDPIQNSFWYATKALAYCEYLKWQSDNSKYKPAVIVPKGSIRLEHQIVANRLGIAIFLFEKVIGGFTMRLIDDRPYWQQTGSI